MKKAIIPAVAALLVLAGCSSEPAPTREEICASVPTDSEAFLSDYFDSATGTAEDALPALYEAQEDAAAIGDDALEEALRDVITILEIAPSGQSGFIEVGVEIQELEQECRFA